MSLGAIVLEGCGKQPSKPSCSAVSSHGNFMSCGEGVPLCGVLALETGLGSGVYRHPQAVVHGLWPAVQNFGDSQCLLPKVPNPPKTIHSCYSQPGTRTSSQLGFEKHEWNKHGVCAGVRDEVHFFQQVCQLSSDPLRVLDAARTQALDMERIVDLLHMRGYCVWQLGSEKQIELSACASNDGHWKLADISEFPTICGTKQKEHLPLEGRMCIPGRHGPSCQSDDDCAGKQGCIRCAASGFCTDVPLILAKGSNLTFLGMRAELGIDLPQAFLVSIVLTFALLFMFFRVRRSMPSFARNLASPMLEEN